MKRGLRLWSAWLPALVLAACSGDEGGASEDATDTTASTGESDAADESDTDTGSEGGEDEGFEPFDWPEEQLSAYVDPMIGTGGVGYTVGTMNPGPALPFSMIKPGPDTGLGPVQISFMNCTGYAYDQPHIWGFSHSRINGMGVPDYGAVQVMASRGMKVEMVGDGGARSLFDHAEEQAEAGYYAVELLEPEILAELTATTRATRHRYTWHAQLDGEPPTLVFNLGYNPADGASIESELSIDAEARTISGMMTVHGSYSNRFGGLPTYFVARVSEPLAGYGVWDEMGGLLPDTAAFSGAQIGAWLEFDLAGAPEASVELELAVSYVSIEAAAQNLAELEGLDFDATRSAASERWDAELSRIRVLGGSEDQRQLFYSALYRSFLTPTIFTEASGEYRGFDDQIHDAGDSTYYSDFSLWDTYRTTHPLFNLVQRDRSAAMMQSLVRMAQQGGDLPKWPLGIGYTGGMVGTSADIVLADAYLKEVEGFDVEAAWDAARLHATEPRQNAGRAGVAGYRERGWVAADEHGASASRTLEFAHADYALARWAEAMGNTADAELFDQGAQSYQHLWSPELEFLIGRRADGSFASEGFDPLVWEDYYSEGTALHYLWAVPHDAAGLAALMGGPEAARARLQQYFEDSDAFLNGGGYNPLEPTPYYWHSNEPSLHAPYLFTELGDPAATQRWVAWARERHYGLGPDGLPGNDDAGTMSAWYVFAAIGLYPLPGGEGYWITAPTFERVELDLGDAQHPDRKLAIVAEGAGPEMIYVAEARFNGELLERPWLTWAQLREAGGTLRLTLSDTPAELP